MGGKNSVLYYFVECRRALCNILDYAFEFLLFYGHFIRL